MKKLIEWLRQSPIKAFFLPPPGAPLARRLLPYLMMGVLTAVLIVGGFVGWGYTNSNEFCGTACHTMPPQFSTVTLSPHARVTCVDCHLGRADFGTKVLRKAQDGWLTFSAMVTGNYNFPIYAHNMRPANDSCEQCHYPQKFSTDTMNVITHFDKDQEQTDIYLIAKTGGGEEREGLGFGIHWHIQNEVFYYTSDEQKLDIPYVEVINDDGTVTEYIDIESGFKKSEMDEEHLYQIDCITCHNRASHMTLNPEEVLDDGMARGVISTDIPDFRHNAVEVLKGDFETQQQGVETIKGLVAYYEDHYAEYYADNSALVEEAVDRVVEAYMESGFPEQGFVWDSHPSHNQHLYSPGCFRCHDGKHLNEENEAIRLECNLCHSIPVTAGVGDIVVNVEISRGLQPENHYSPNWITLHRDIFDPTCESCHTVEDPGGSSNTSFCSNSACHGTKWTYAGFDAPALREVLSDELTAMIPTPAPTPEPLAEGVGATWDTHIADIFTKTCSACHGVSGQSGLDMSTYEALMTGGINGAVVVPGEIDKSTVIGLTKSGHFAKFSADDLQMVSDWIAAGAPEN